MSPTAFVTEYYFEEQLPCQNENIINLIDFFVTLVQVQHL
jgi:hypothetical protein